MKKVNPVMKFSGDLVDEFENGKPSGNPSTYYITGDTLYMRGTFRQDENKSKIRISNDTLYMEVQLYTKFSSIKWHYKLDVPENVNPEDVEIERSVRYITCVRAEDCDKYVLD